MICESTGWHMCRLNGSHRPDVTVTDVFMDVVRPSMNNRV